VVVVVNHMKGLLVLEVVQVGKAMQVAQVQRGVVQFKVAVAVQEQLVRPDLLVQ
jgi:hypothetical protein